jgi:hypothetical protein
MKRTGKFITEDERQRLQTAYQCSGMWTSNGTPLGDPGFEADQLCKKYGMSLEHGIDLKTGEFCKP